MRNTHGLITLHPVAELTLNSFKVLVEVARAGSFSGAAERLDYTQSAVSRQIASAETAIGMPLFERGARGVRPTAAGEALLRHAGRVLDDVAAAKQELTGMRDRVAGRLVVGGYPTAMASLIPRALARLLDAHPAIEVRLAESPTPRQLAALRRGRLEVAVVATGEGLPEYDLDGLRLNELRGGRGIGVAVAESHPFAARGAVDPDELADQRWIVGDEGEGPQFAAWPGLENPTIAFAVSGWPTRLGLVAAGLGVALMPGSAADLIPQGVRWIRVRSPQESFRRSTWAVTGSEPSPAAAAMVAALVDEVESWSAPRPPA